MAKKHVIDSNKSATVDIDHGKLTLVVNAGVTIAATSSDGLQNLKGGGYDNVVYKIGGLIESVSPSSESGINDDGDNNRLIVGHGGKIDAAYGVSAMGDDFTVVNNGTVFGAQASAFLFGGGDFVLHNRGWIDGDAAATRGVMITANGKGLITNSETALIGASIIDQADNARTTILNEGGIWKSDFWDFSMDLGGGNDKLVNRGKVIGDIYMGAGNDIIDLRRGELSGDAHGGLGNDRYFITDDLNSVHESLDEGTDTIVTTISWIMNNGAEGHFEILKAAGKCNIDLEGNSDDTRFIGNAGRNRIEGHTGDDRITGGAGKDVIVFSDFEGVDTFTDFENGKDKFDFSGWSSINSFTDVQALLKAKGKDVWIDRGDEGIVLLNTKIRELDATDFTF